MRQDLIRPSSGYCGIGAYTSEGRWKGELIQGGVEEAGGGLADQPIVIGMRPIQNQR
jgi:hypothetical protein